MKYLPLLPLFIFAGHLSAKIEKPEPVALDDLFYADSLWETPISKVMESKGSGEKDDDDDDGEGLPIEVLKRMEERGIDITKYEVKVGSFEWLSAAKEGLRATRGGYSLNEKEIGETIIRGDENGLSSVTISIYNRGDDEEIGPSVYETLLNEWKTAMDGALKSRASSRDQGGSVPITGWMWKNDNSAFLLEGSLNRREKRPEFIRLRIAPSKPLGSVADGRVKRGALTENIKKNEKGDVWVDGVPMVDQGEKGYCVVASVERVLRYYGRQVDQHEMARLADTTAGGGTSTTDMEKAFRSITGKTNVRTIKLFEFDDNDFKKDVRKYNQVARKAEKKTFDIDLDEWIVSPVMFWDKVDPELLRDIKAEQNGFATFNRKIEEYIDQGVPINWVLILGLFKEGDMPQSYGGHMRLITGYNRGTGEIIYTDSWGEGHEHKRMRADEAYCMTMGMYAMVPTR